MSILLDQNIPIGVKAWLQTVKPEWKVFHVNEEGLACQPDERVFQWAQVQNAVIVTYDEDFADSRMYSLGSHYGIIRLRVWPTTIENTCSAMERLFRGVPDEEWKNGLVIIDNHKIRIRVRKDETGR